VIGVLTVLLPATGRAQNVTYPKFETTETVNAVPPMTKRERLNWIVDGVAGPRNVAMTAFSQTDVLWTTPDDQSRVARFAKRFAQAEVSTAISRSVEGSLGAIWGEDPRTRHTHPAGFWPRTRHAAEGVMLAPRADGHLAPAWGRLAGTVASTVAANAWIPDDERTSRETAYRIGSALVSSLINRLWEEFWPDIRTKLPPVPRPFAHLAGGNDE
jgi:hypothetical protein